MTNQPRRRVMLLSDDYAGPETAVRYRWVTQQYDAAEDTWATIGFGGGECESADEMSEEALGWLDSLESDEAGDREAARELDRMP
jgi:hypothetical protein